MTSLKNITLSALFCGLSRSVWHSHVMWCTLYSSHSWTYVNIGLEQPQHRWSIQLHLEFPRAVTSVRWSSAGWGPRLKRTGHRISDFSWILMKCHKSQQTKLVNVSSRLLEELGWCQLHSSKSFVSFSRQLAHDLERDTCCPNVPWSHRAGLCFR